VFGWLKRKAQLAVISAAEKDIDRFLASLRGADLDQLGMIVAVATHWRNAFKRDGIGLLDPYEAERKNPALLMILNRFLKDVQKDNPTFAVGIMVWLHTVRAATIPEIRYKGRMMWGELAKGFPRVEEAGADLSALTGVPLQLEAPALIPAGLEPDHR
jgi:hypothetical protein